MSGSFFTILLHEEIAAINSVKNTQSDLILMNIKLKGKMSGIEAVKQIKNSYNTPIFFLSGNTNKETKQQALMLNPCEYLQKPFDHKKLIKTIKSIIPE